MTYIGEARRFSTVTEVLRGGARRRTRRREKDAAQSAWESEGGALEATWGKASSRR